MKVKHLAVFALAMCATLIGCNNNKKSNSLKFVELAGGTYSNAFTKADDKTYEAFKLEVNIDKDKSYNISIDDFKYTLVDKEVKKSCIGFLEGVTETEDDRTYTTFVENNIEVTSDTKYIYVAMFDIAKTEGTEQKYYYKSVELEIGKYYSI